MPGQGINEYARAHLNALRFFVPHVDRFLSRGRTTGKIKNVAGIYARTTTNRKMQTELVHRAVDAAGHCAGLLEHCDSPRDFRLTSMKKAHAVIIVSWSFAFRDDRSARTGRKPPTA